MIEVAIFLLDFLITFKCGLNDSSQSPVTVLDSTFVVLHESLKLCGLVRWNYRDLPSSGCASSCMFEHIVAVCNQTALKHTRLIKKGFMLRVNQGLGVEELTWKRTELLKLVGMLDNCDKLMLVDTLELQRFDILVAGTV